MPLGLRLARSCSWGGGVLLHPWDVQKWTLVAGGRLSQEFASLGTRWATSAQAVTTQLTYVPIGGAMPYVSAVFARLSSKFLDAGTRILYIRSNGDFTAVAVVMFTGSAGSWERIFDAGNAVGNKIISLEALL